MNKKIFIKMYLSNHIINQKLILILIVILILIIVLLLDVRLSFVLFVRYFKSPLRRGCIENTLKNEDNWDKGQTKEDGYVVLVL